jgi:acyl-CoA thioester hydrolase
MLGFRMTAFKFENDVTVRFAETDAQGIAHHASYLVWFEATRIEYLRRFRGGYLGLREEGIDALTLEAHARYVSAASFDDRLTIRARCSDVRGARFRFDYAVERDGASIAEGWTTHACVSVGDHRPTRVPTWLADAIADAES